MSIVSQLLLEESGQGVTEYTLILSVLVLSIIGAYINFGPKTAKLFSNALDEILSY